MDRRYFFDCSCGQRLWVPFAQRDQNWNCTNCGRSGVPPKFVEQVTAFVEGAEVPDELRAAVLLRDRWTCAKCGGIALSIDHVLPVYFGGLTSYQNCQAMCLSDNCSKGNRLSARDLFRLALQRQPVSNALSRLGLS